MSRIIRAGRLIAVAALTACVEAPTTPSAILPAGALELAGQVVRAVGDVDEPVGGLTLYLYMPVEAGTRGAQWIHHGSGTSFYSPQGFWAVPLAKQRSDVDGKFRFTGLEAGAYVLWVVPDALKGCSQGAVMSLQLSPSMEPLLVRAL